MKIKVKSIVNDLDTTTVLYLVPVKVVNECLISMFSITNILYIYLQNVYKNYVLVNNFLKAQKDLYDILFI